MTIIELFGLGPDERQYWTAHIGEGNWRAAKYLAELLNKNAFHERYGEDGRVLLLTDGQDLVSFCTLVGQDEIDDHALRPWIGFVYTFPAYRGHRCSQMLIDYACAKAKEQGNAKMYLSSDERGLYEKYGFTPWKQMRTLDREMTQVYVRPLREDV